MMIESTRLSLAHPSSIAGWFLRLPLRLVPKGLVVRVRSGINHGARWVVGSSTHGCWLGHYEKEKQLAIEHAVSPGQVAFDIGANVGFYSIAFGRMVGPSGKVWAFEPLAENVNNLLRHVSLNGLDNITIVQAAVSDCTSLSGFTRARHNAMGRLSDDSSYLVPTVSIDGLRDKLKLPIPHVMKIDVEGAEELVLRGARQTLAIGETTVFLAIHGSEPERACLRILDEMGYRIEYLDGTPATARPLRSDEIVAFPPQRAKPTIESKRAEDSSCAA